MKSSATSSSIPVLHYSYILKENKIDSKDHEFFGYTDSHILNIVLSLSSNSYVTLKKLFNRYDT